MAKRFEHYKVVIAMALLDTVLVAILTSYVS